MAGLFPYGKVRGGILFSLAFWYKIETTRDGGKSDRRVERGKGAARLEAGLWCSLERKVTVKGNRTDWHIAGSG